MIRLQPSWLIFSILILSLSLGCARKEEPPLTLREADQRFLELCREEFKEPVVIKRIKDTLWIYYPTPDEILTIEASGPKTSVYEKPKLNLKPVEGYYTDPNFHVDYEVTVGNKVVKSMGIGFGYSSLLKQVQRNFMQILQRTYFDVEAQETYPLSEEEDATLPKFLVLAVADITKGVEFENIYYVDDLKKSLGPSPYITGEEYILRTVSESRGDKAIIGDRKGAHLDYRDITMTEFLARQIANRITFKFQHSDFPPMDQVESEIFKIIAVTLDTYQYTDYESAILTELKENESSSLSKTDLTAYLPDESTKRDQNKYTVIEFNGSDYPKFREKLREENKADDEKIVN